MLEIRQCPLPPHDLILSPDYVPLIPPPLLHELASQSAVTDWIATEARVGGKLAALALAEIYAYNRLAKLQSLEIGESFKGQGIWRSLFVFIQDFLAKEKKVRGVEWTFDQGSPSAPAVEKILVSLGWPPPELYLMRLHFDAYAFNPRWIQRPNSLPSTMHFFPWKELSLDDRGHIDYLSQQGRFLPYLSPLLKAETIDLETSIGLRQGDTLIGWSITRRPDPSTIVYASLYIDSGLLRSGYGIQLLIESIRRHKALPIPHALLELSLHEIDHSWWHFVNKRLIPLASKIDRIKRTFHVFHQDS